MIDAYIKPIKEFVDLLFKISNSVNDKKIEKHHKDYARIYFLLIELKDSSEHLMDWLRHTEKYFYLYYFAHGLKIVSTIEKITFKIIDIMVGEFPVRSLFSVLILENIELYENYSLLMKDRLHRIRLWQNVVSRIAKETDGIADYIFEHEDELCKKNQLMNKKIIITEIQDITFPSINELKNPSIHLYHPEYFRSPKVKSYEAAIDKFFLQKQISITETTIKEIDYLIKQFQTFMKQNVSIKDIL